MLTASIAALEAAVASRDLEGWLSRVPDEALRARLARAVAVDRRLCAPHPASLASCLLARTFGDHACAELHAAWITELEQRALPWIRPHRAIPVPEDLIAELHAGQGLSFTGLHLPRFEGDEVVVEARQLPPGVQAPELRRQTRLRWAWSRDEARIEPDPRPDPPFAPDHHPRFEHPCWGPSYLVRAPGEAGVALPCPEDGSASACFTSDGSRVIVYGTLDEYAGGFVRIVDPRTLDIERYLDTSSPVWGVRECGPEQMLVSTSSGTIAWMGSRAIPLPDLPGALCLSPDGALLASFGEGLRIWSFSGLLRREPTPSRAGFPPRFDPTGDRLVAGNRLLDAHTGQVIAELDIQSGTYLEGGPAQPWFHVGARHLICAFSGMRVWDTQSGKPLKMSKRLHFPQWYALAYDRLGERLAVLHRGEARVTLHSLPSGRTLRELTFELPGTAVAMSPDARLIALHQGAAVEIRSATGALVRRFGAVPRETVHRGRYADSLRFSHDGERIACFVDDQGWFIRQVSGEGGEERLTEHPALIEVADFMPPRPSDWTIEVDTRTLFTHTPTGTQIALPVTGRWEVNPGDPTIVACDDLLLELRRGRHFGMVTR